MTIAETNLKTKCDFYGCKNLAEIIISSEFDSKRKICFCKDCLNGIYQIYAKSIIPKSIDAPFKKQKKLR